METSDVCLTLSYSFTGRIVTKMVQRINQMNSRVYLEKGMRTVNMRSILGVLSAGCMAGDTIKIMCLNDDLEQAKKDLEIIKKMIELGE